MDKIRYKGCDCPGTSSGPREVFIVPEEGQMRLVRVEFACDECDAPWSEWIDRTHAAASAGKGEGE